MLLNLGMFKKRDMDDIDRSLWVTNGQLDLDLDKELLVKICAKFAAIGAVPNEYFYPELF